MLRAENLSFQIGGTTLINDVSLTLMPGEFTMVLGPNGAGKSTLLKLLTGTEVPQQGQIWYGDQLLPSISLATLAPAESRAFSVDLLTIRSECFGRSDDGSLPIL